MTTMVKSMMSSFIDGFKDGFKDSVVDCAWTLVSSMFDDIFKAGRDEGLKLLEWIGKVATAAAEYAKGDMDRDTIMQVVKELEDEGKTDLGKVLRGWADIVDTYESTKATEVTRRKVVERPRGRRTKRARTK